MKKTVSTAAAKKPRVRRSTGKAFIPSFNADPDQFEVEMPFCCGILVVGEFSNEPLDMVQSGYDQEYGIAAPENVNEKFTEEWDYGKRRYIRIKNPFYDPDHKPHPMLQTKNLTKKQAREWWEWFAEQNGYAQLLATLTEDNQDTAGEMLRAGGWKAVSTFMSKSTGRTITVFSFTHSKFDKSKKK